MRDEQTNGLQYFVIIASKKKKNEFLSLLGDYGAHVVETTYGYGSMSPSVLAAAFGFETEQKKVLISALVKREQAERLMQVLQEKYDFDQPNTGIAFSVSVEGLAF